MTGARGEPGRPAPFEPDSQPNHKPHAHPSAEPGLGRNPEPSPEPGPVRNPRPARKPVFKRSRRSGRTRHRKFSLEHALGVLLACALGAFLAHRSLTLGIVACALASSIAGFVVGRHSADRSGNSEGRSGNSAERSGDSAKAPGGPSPAGAASAPHPPREESRHPQRRSARTRTGGRAAAGAAAPTTKDRAALEANPSTCVRDSVATASEIVQRFRRNASIGIPTALVVLELAPISKRARALNREQFMRALEVVAEALDLGRGWVCALESRRLLILVAPAGEAGALECAEQARTALWRRARIASKAGFACAPKDGWAFLAVLHRARKRAAAARYDLPAGAVRPPFPLGQNLSKRV